MKKFLYILTIGFSAALVSCEKETPSPTPNPTPHPNPNPTTITQDRAKILSDHTWRMTGFYQNASDLYASGFRNCQKDDVYSFQTNGTLAIDEGAVTCSPSSSTGKSWSLSADKHSLTINFDEKPITGVQGNLSIKSFSDTKMELQQTVNGDVYTSVFTTE